jgi:hypothetical protein
MSSVEEIQGEIEALRSLTPEILASVAKVHPSGSLPRLGLFEGTYYEPIYGPTTVRCDVSFPVIFDDGTEWVINFPLLCRTAHAFRKVETEVATLKWVKANTALPVPSVHGYDSLGNSSWNTLRRPCIVLDRMPGRHITNSDWEGMTTDQQLLVFDQLAKIKAELTTNSFPRIGSLYLKNGQIFVDRLISPTTNRYCTMHARNRRLADIFKMPKSPYSTAMEFLVDMANLRLLYEATRSTDMTEQWVDMWIYRSIIPSLIPDEFNRGPFFLGHSSLDRTAVLFDNQFRLTGIINWSFSVIEPVQIAALLPTFFKALPINYETEPHYLQGMVVYYAKALRKYELQIRQQKQKKGDQPFLGDLTEVPSILHNAGYFLSAPVSIENTEVVWEHIIQPTFGGVERATLMNLYRNAPGLLEEFKRTRLFLQS